MTVNVSGKQFNAPNIVETVVSAFKSSGLDPRYIGLELTESSLMGHADRNIRTLHELKEQGLTLSIDDFGTGYSSLSYLKRFPLDELKIDRSFVSHVDSDPDNAAIVIAIIAMAHCLGLSVVAEGVETPAQQAFLKSEELRRAAGLSLLEADAGGDVREAARGLAARGRAGEAARGRRHAGRSAGLVPHRVHRGTEQRAGFPRALCVLCSFASPASAARGTSPPTAPAAARRSPGRSAGAGARSPCGSRCRSCLR